MGQYRFIRNTTLREGRQEYKAGEVVELSGAALRHWLLRGAVEAQQAAAPPEAPLAPPAPPAEVETPEASVETADASQDDDHPGDRAEPVAPASRVRSSSAPAKKGGGNRRK